MNMSYLIFIMKGENLMEDKKQTKIIYGSKNNFYLSDEGNMFGIAFDKFLDYPELEVYNEFEITSKRNFKNLGEMIVDTYRDLFVDMYGELKDENYILIFYALLNLKSEIMLNENETRLEDFMDSMINILNGNDQLLKNTINQYIDDNYKLDLDAVTEETISRNRKVDEELIITDEHGKDLLRVAFTLRFFIPIISVYLAYNKGIIGKTDDEIEGDDDLEDLRFDEINETMMNSLFDEMVTKPDELRGKLYKLTSSRMARTEYADRGFWAFADTQGVNVKSKTLEVYNKLLQNAVTKLSIEGNLNILSYILSVINNQIGFMVRDKYKHRFSIMNRNRNGGIDGSDDLSEYDRLEVQMLKADEGMFALRKLSIENVMLTLPEKLGVSVTDNEVKENLNKLDRHKIQEQIASMLTYKYFEDKSAVKIMDHIAYTRLILLLQKYLIKHKFEYLPKIMISTATKFREKDNIVGRKVRPEIMGSKKYTELFNLKYADFADEVERPLIKTIATTYGSVYVDSEDDIILDNTVKVGKIADEIIDLAFLV